MIKPFAFTITASLIFITGCSKEDSTALKNDLSTTYEDAKNATKDGIHEAAESVSEKTQ